MQKNHNIPLITDLVAPGDPTLKVSATESPSSHIDDLNGLIDDLESAIGQDSSSPIGRAFAIRAETAN